MGNDIPAACPQPEGLNKTAERMLRLLDAFSGQGLHAVPFKGSWTAAQVADHVTKSNRSIAQALHLEGSPADRKPDERARELQAMFLDFTVKFQSPDFILPGAERHAKDIVSSQLEQSVVLLRHAAAGAVLTESIQHPAFGEITKLELLYFVDYHTQRHTRQLQHIYETVERKQYRFLSFLFQPPLPIF